MLIRLSSRVLLPVIILMLCSIQIPAQDRQADKEPSENGAKITNQTQNADQKNDDDPLAQMLQQSIAEARAWKSLAETRLLEIQAKDRLSATDEILIKRYEQIVKASDELIERLEKGKCSTTSLFFGFLKFKRC